MNAAMVTVGNTGGGQPISIMQPYLGIYHSIALFGIYPSRN
jgi:microcystin-dependent protein